MLSKENIHISKIYAKIPSQGASMQFADPKNDLAFKKIFGNDKHKNILISFLNSILHLLPCD